MSFISFFWLLQPLLRDGIRMQTTDIAHRLFPNSIIIKRVGNKEYYHNLERDKVNEMLNELHKNGMIQKEKFRGQWLWFF